MAHSPDTALRPTAAASRTPGLADQPPGRTPGRLAGHPAEPSLEALVLEGAAQGRAAARQAALQSLPSQPGGSRAGLPDELSGRGRILNLVT